MTKKDLKNKRKPKPCKALMSDLVLVFGIDIKYDNVGTHAQFVS